MLAKSLWAIKNKAMRRYGEMHSLPNEALHYAMYHLFQPIGQVALGLKTAGREHIPDRGAAVIASNHRHWADTMVLPYAVKKRHVTMVARDDLTSNRLVQFLFRHGEVIQIGRHDYSTDDQREIDVRIAEERLLAMFVEETRGDKIRRRDDRRAKLGPFKPGVAFQARRHKIPTVPAAISGLDNVLTRKHRREARVAFGEPMEYPRPGRESKTIFMDELKGRVEELYYQTLESSPRGGISEEEAKIADELVERRSQVALLEIDSFISEYLDRLDPAIRPRMIGLYDQEISVLRNLDPQSTSLEEIAAIKRSFYEQREAFDPNRSARSGNSGT